MGITQSPLSAAIGKMEILPKDRYNPDLVPSLEEYVDKQISGGSFDLSANLILLRMYSFFPDRTNSTVLVKVLVKALMQLPGTDFSLCTYLVPHRFQLEEPVANLLKLAEYAESMRFKEFWELASKCKYLWEKIPGFELAVRRFALHAVQLTFSRIPKKKLEELLSLVGGELDVLVNEQCAKSGWISDGEGMITIPKNSET